jgi:hypothetical protein
MDFIIYKLELDTFCRFDALTYVTLSVCLSTRTTRMCVCTCFCLSKCCLIQSLSFAYCRNKFFVVQFNGFQCQMLWIEI